MKQSSIEWLVENLTMVYPRIQEMRLLVEKAKEMHKDEIEQSYYDGIVCSMSDQDTDMLKLSEQYYNETFNSK